METGIPLGGRVSAARLVTLLGRWRRSGVRRGASDLAAAIELHVSDGQLPPGTLLPAERELAGALGVSRTLVGAALDRLRESGVVASRRGAGSWIVSRARREPEPARPDVAGLINFARAAPAAVPGTMAAVDAARERLTEELLDDGYTMHGLPELRRRIADRYTARGLPTTPAQVLVCNGAHHGFVLALRMLAGPGDRVLVEQPTYPNALEAVRSVPAQPVPVPLDPDEGWRPDDLRAVLRQASPRLAYLNVDFHNPTGLRMDAEARQWLANEFVRAATPIVVDETFAELDLDGDPLEGPPPLAAFAREWTIALGSAAKSHWGGLRLGWIRAPEDVLARLRSARFSLDLGSPVLDQLVLAELLADPGAVLCRREQARVRRDVLIDAVRRHFPDWSFRVPEGGLALWCRLPSPMSTRLSVAAVGHGVQLAPSSRFAVHGGLERWVRLPFTHPPKRLEEAVRRLGLAAAATGAGRPADVTVI